MKKVLVLLSLGVLLLGAGSAMGQTSDENVKKIWISSIGEPEVKDGGVLIKVKVDARFYSNEKNDYYVDYKVCPTSSGVLGALGLYCKTGRLQVQKGFWERI